MPQSGIAFSRNDDTQQAWKQRFHNAGPKRVENRRSLIVLFYDSRLAKHAEVMGGRGLAHGQLKRDACLVVMAIGQLSYYPTPDWIGQRRQHAIDVNSVGRRVVQSSHASIIQEVRGPGDLQILYLSYFDAYRT